MQSGKKEVALFKTETFYADGIISEELFNQNPPGKKYCSLPKNRMLQVMKRRGPEFCNGMECGATAHLSFAQRLAEWAYGIINAFPPYERMENKLSYLKRIAFMNVKKSGGGAFTDNAKMYAIVQPQCAFILKEVNIIEPDIIVACVSFAEHLIEDIFGKVKFKSSGYNVKIGRYNNSKVINFYHPSRTQYSGCHL